MKKKDKMIISTSPTPWRDALDSRATLLSVWQRWRQLHAAPRCPTITLRCYKLLQSVNARTLHSSLHSNVFITIRFSLYFSQFCKFLSKFINKILSPQFFLKMPFVLSNSLILQDQWRIKRYLLHHEFTNFNL